MAYNYSTIQALVNERYLPGMIDNIFAGKHYLWDYLKRNLKTYNERQISIGIEYAVATTLGFTARNQTFALRNEEIATRARYAPSMHTSTMVILTEDELENTSTEAVESLLSLKTANLQKSIEQSLANYVWTRGTAAISSPNWNTIDFLVNNQAAVDVGDLLTDTSVPAWWKSKVVDLQNDAFFQAGGASSLEEADLMDSSKHTFLKRMFARLLSLAEYQNGGSSKENGDNDHMIIAPQYVCDCYEAILDEQKTGNKYNDRAGSAGFKLLDYRGVPIVPDSDMVANQTGDNDGRIYCLNPANIYLFLNSGAKFTAGPFIEAENSNRRSSKVLAYGNLAISNRARQAVLQNIYSPKSYSTAA